MQYGRRAVAAVAGALMLIALGATPRAARAVVAGQADNFESGTTENWRGGPAVGNPNPNPPINVTSGGPAGTNDNYLLVRSTAIGTSGSKLVAFNSDQWAGNYISAGVGSIQMQVNNLDFVPPEPGDVMVLRLVLTNTLGQGLSTIADVTPPEGGGWQTVTFSLAESNLSNGNVPGVTYAGVMGAVAELNLAYAENPITHRQQSPAVAAQLGVDNVTALPVPEPAAAGAAGAAVLLAALRRGGRRRRAGG